MENKDDSLDILIELKEELETHLFFSNPKTSKRNTPSNISCILELPSPSGLSIQVGRNHRQNEIISLKKARRGDLWFHSQECPGSHVVLKASNGIFEDDDLQICADLAAFFSKARLNKKVPVIMVKTNQLQKLKGSIPGTVTFRGGKIIWGDPLKGKGHLEKTNLGTAEAHNALSSAPS